MNSLFRNLLLLIVLTGFFVPGCKSDKESCSPPDLSGISLTIDYTSFIDELDRLDSKEALVDFLKGQPVLRDHFFHRQAYPDDSAFVNTLFDLYQNPFIDTLFKEVKRVFGNEDGLKNEFEQAFKTIRYYYPDFVPPKVITAVSGLLTDLVVSDTLIIVGLDFYLGEGARYRPDFYEYMLIHYRPESIVPSYMLLYGIDEPLNRGPDKISAERTVLDDMISYGKAYYFAEHMLPCTPDSVLIGYTSEEIRETTENQDIVWYRLIDNEVLYATDHQTKQKYLLPRPHTFEIGDRCPGRIAQWVGWQLVRSYMKAHPGLSLQDLMLENNSIKILQESKYKPG